MKLNTTAFAKFESVGKPKSTVELHDKPLREIILEFGKWTQNVYMGSHMRITIARSHEELTQLTTGRRVANDDDMMQQLESLLDQETLQMGDDEPDLPLDSNPEENPQ